MKSNIPKIYFIWTAWERLYLLNYNIPPMGILRIAGATPASYPVEFTDEMVSPVSRDSEADIVAISFLTPAALNAYALGDHFRSKGRYVVFGGTHTTIMPDEARAHADTIIIGEGEALWGQFLTDYNAGIPRPVYQAGEFPDLSGLAPVRRELLPIHQYPYENPIEIGVESMEFSRGCAARCAYCVVPSTQGPEFRNIPLNDIVTGFEDVSLTAGFLFFTDNNLLGNWDQTRCALETLIPYEKDWFGLLAPEDAVKDADKLDLMVKSGLAGVYGTVKVITGKESPGELKKRIRRIRRLMDLNIAVIATFAFGWDDHDEDVFKRTLDFGREARLTLPEFIINTPFPGSRQFNQFTKEGRILTRDWGKYNGNYAVYQPRTMSVNALESGYRWINEEFYSGIDRDQSFFDKFRDRAFESMIRARKKQLDR